VCPVEAIFGEFDLPYEWETYAVIDALWYVDKNAARAKLNAVKAEG
jgi:hypothetical protein